MEHKETLTLKELNVPASSEQFCPKFRKQSVDNYEQLNIVQEERCHTTWRIRKGNNFSFAKESQDLYVTDVGTAKENTVY